VSRPAASTASPTASIDGRRLDVDGREPHRIDHAEARPRLDAGRRLDGDDRERTASLNTSIDTARLDGEHGEQGARAALRWLRRSGSAGSSTVRRARTGSGAGGGACRRRPPARPRAAARAGGATRPSPLRPRAGALAARRGLDGRRTAGLPDARSGEACAYRLRLPAADLSCVLPSTQVRP
jgi:hypothetical protein